jgi:hypothetical protein
LEDAWCGPRPFRDIYPNLYHVCYEPHNSVAQVMGNTPYNLSFRRSLVGVKLTEYNDLMAKIGGFRLSDERDTVSWDLHRTGQFSTRSMYLKLMNHDTPFRHKLIWKLKLPLKIKIFSLVPS